MWQAENKTDCDWTVQCLLCRRRIGNAVGAVHVDVCGVGTTIIGYGMWRKYGTCTNDVGTPGFLFIVGNHILLLCNFS